MLLAPRKSYPSFPTINGFFANEHGLISETFISHSLGVVQKPIFFLCEFKKRSRSSLVWTPSVLQKKKGKKLKVKGTSQVVRKGLVGLN